MQKLSFVPKERIYRFSTNHKKMALFHFLSKYVDSKEIKQAFKYFDVRIDTRYKCEGKFASVIPYKDETGKIRDVEVAIIDPHTGLLLGDGDPRAMMQQTKRQNRNSDYFSCPSGNKCWSIANELAKGYSLQRQDTLFGLDKVSEYSHNQIHMVSSADDAIKMKAIFPFATWVAIGKKDLQLNADIARVFRGRRVRLYRDIDDTDQRILKMKYALLKHGAKVEIDSYLCNVNSTRLYAFEFDYLDKSEEPEMLSISTIALNFLGSGCSRDIIASCLQIEQCIPF